MRIKNNAEEAEKFIDEAMENLDKISSNGHYYHCWVIMRRGERDKDILWAYTCYFDDYCVGSGYVEDMLKRNEEEGYGLKYCVFYNSVCIYNDINPLVILPVNLEYGKQRGEKKWKTQFFC